MFSKRSKYLSISFSNKNMTHRPDTCHLVHLHHSRSNRYRCHGDTFCHRYNYHRTMHIPNHRSFCHILNIYIKTTSVSVYQILSTCTINVSIWSANLQSHAACVLLTKTSSKIEGFLLLRNKINPQLQMHVSYYICQIGILNKRFKNSPKYVCFFKEVIVVMTEVYFNTFLTSVSLISRNTAQTMSRVDITSSLLTVYRTRTWAVRSKIGV